MPAQPGQLFQHLEGSSSIYTTFEDPNRPSRINNSAPSKWKLKVLKRILTITLALVLLFLPQSFADLITLYYTGFITNTYQFAGIAFSLICGNIFIARVAACFLESLQALTRQALFCQQYFRISAHYQKTIVLTVACVALGCIILFGFSYLMIPLGFSAEFSYTFRLFNLVSIPYYFANLLFNLVKSLYLSYGILRTPIALTWIRAFLIICLNIIFQAIWGPNLYSIALSRDISEIIVALSLYLYTKSKNRFAQAIRYPWTMQVFQNLKNFAKLLLARGSFVYINKVPLDILTLITLFMYQPEILAAQCCLNIYATFLIAMPYAVCIATSRHFKIATEEGNEQKARNYAVMGCVVIFITCIILTGTNIFIYTRISKIFWNNPIFQVNLNHLIQIYLIALWCDICFQIQTIIFRKFIGRLFILKCALIIFWGISLPLSVVLGLPVGWGINGIWGARLFGLLLANLVLVRKLTVLDWWQQVRKIHFGQKDQLDDTLLDL